MSQMVDKNKNNMKKNKPRNGGFSPRQLAQIRQLLIQHNKTNKQSLYVSLIALGMVLFLFAAQISYGIIDIPWYGSMIIIVAYAVGGVWVLRLAKKKIGDKL